MPAAPSKLAIVVRGGWDGHAPIEATDLFIPHLEANGYEVRIFDSPAPYADPDLMARTDLIMQCNTMATIARDEACGPRAVIANGTGTAGWHGGIADLYRNSSDYFQLIGAQFACHPGKDPATITGDGPENNYVPYTVNLLPVAVDHHDHPGASRTSTSSPSSTGRSWTAIPDVLATDDPEGPAVG